MSPDPIHFLAGTLVCRLDTRRLNRSRCDEFGWGLRQIIREMATGLEVQADPALITMDFVKEVYARCNPDMHMGAQALKDALADLIRRMVTEQTDEFLLRHRHVA